MGKLGSARNPIVLTLTPLTLSRSTGKGDWMNRFAVSRGVFGRSLVRRRSHLANRGLI